MRTTLILTFWSLIVTVLLGAVFNCASNSTSTPNPVYEGAYLEDHETLNKFHPLLAKEFGKLPEIQDGLSDAENAALFQIFEFYKENPNRFNTTFNRMYQIGKPECRKYCSPLQALFWLTVNGNLEQARLSIRYYSLKALLNRAWLPDLFNIRDEDIAGVLSTMEEEVREEYVNLYNNVGKVAFWKYINADYKAKPQLFSQRSAKLIEDVNNRGDKPRWSDFDIVVDRLNSPELLDYYIDQRIRYNSVPRMAIGRKAVFDLKHGDCDDLVLFGNYVLRRAGYKTLGRRVYNDIEDGHAGLAIELAYARYLLVVNFGPSGNWLSGPYQNLYQVDYELGYGRQFRKRGSFSLGSY